MKLEGRIHSIFDISCTVKPIVRLGLSAFLAVGTCLCFSTVEYAQQSQAVEQPATTGDSQAAPAAQQTTAQSTKTTSSETQSTSQQEKKKKKKKGESRGAFAAAPLPISNPAVGSGIVPVVGYIFPFSKKDKISPPSVIGAGGLITNNGSRAFVFGGQLFVKENRYQITSAYGRGNLDYNIYIANQKLPLVQTGNLFWGEFLRRSWWKLFVGPRFIAGDSVITIKPNNTQDFPLPPDLGLHTNLVAIGARATWDTSDNRFYPLQGSFFTFTSDFFAQDLGSKYTYQSYKTQFNKYWSLSKKQVLAYDGYFCATGGKPPFYGNCIYGSSAELRGYTAGRYFDRYMMATQAEYRLVLPWRFGVVGFGGIGGVVAGQDQYLQKSHFLPDGGTGLRFDLSPKYHVNLRADLGWGTDGHTFTLGVLEAF
jgi:Omp85 superfamily domain